MNEQTKEYSFDSQRVHFNIDVRNFRRLNELLVQLVAAVKAIESVELEEKFKSGSKLLQRGIIFAGSLYL